ncbi:MAG: transposase [Janthinobacterium lividum]
MAKVELNAGLFIQLLLRLIKDADRKLFVILDNLRVRRAKLVMAWVAQNSEWIELFYLPLSTPECNPDEYISNDVRQVLGCYAMPRDKVTMKA